MWMKLINRKAKNTGYNHHFITITEHVYINKPILLMEKYPLYLLKEFQQRLPPSFPSFTKG